MKTKLFFILCTAIPTSAIVAMDETCHITVKNLLQHEVNVVQKINPTATVGVADLIQANNQKILPLITTGGSQLTITLPRCIPKKIILCLNDNQQTITIKQISAKDIAIIDNNMQQLARTSYQ